MAPVFAVSMDRAIGDWRRRKNGKFGRSLSRASLERRRMKNKSGKALFIGRGGRWADGGD